MVHKGTIVAEVLDASGGPAPFKHLRIETESLNDRGETVFKQLGLLSHNSDAENRYSIRYTLKRENASIWLVLVDEFGETKKRIQKGKHRIVLRSEAQSGLADGTAGRSVIYNYTIGEFNMSKQVIKGSPGAVVGGRDVTSRQVNSFNRDSYNSIKDHHGSDVADAFRNVGQVIAKGKNSKAKKAFDDLSKEAAKSKHQQKQTKVLLGWLGQDRTSRC